MIPFLLRQLWRLTIFALGALVLQFLITTFWPESGSRLAAFFALLLIYSLMAYIVIPNLMRIFHIFSRPNHIPLYAATGDGWPSDPVNLAIVVRNRKKLVSIFKSAGWYESDPLTFRNGFRELLSILFNTPYPEAPLSNLYLFDRPHDVAFAIPTNQSGSARTRHHIRFWRLEKPVKEARHGSHYDFWREKVRHFLHVDKEIWIGAATEDIRFIDIKWRTGQLTHGVSHESEKERDYVIKTLEDKHMVKKIYTTEAGERLRFRGQSFRTLYTTDGSIKIIQLKNPLLK